MVLWLIGLSGAGKTTIGKSLYDRLKPAHRNLVFLDGDILREVWGDKLSHTLEDRRRNAERISRLCKMLDSQGINVICAILSIFPESREWNRANYSSYFEVFVKAPFDLLVQRDNKGLYRDALAGRKKNVAGVDLPFPEPERPDLVLENDFTQSPDQLAERIARKVRLD